jgi:hypothetical protein
MHPLTDNKKTEFLEQIEVLAVSLKKMPLFNLMLGGQELFHSNFIAWILEQHPHLLADFFRLSDHSGVKKWYVIREKYNFDFLISDADENSKQEPKFAILIENKFKSLVDNIQLQNYQEKIKKPDNRYCHSKHLLIVLSAHQPLEALPHGWHLKTYDDLADTLKSHLADSHYISDYVDLIFAMRKFSTLIEQYEMKNKWIGWFSPQEDRTTENSRKIDKIAESIRYNDTLNKLRAQNFRRQLNIILSDRFSVENFPTVKIGFTNKEPFLEAFWQTKIVFDGNKITANIGLQIQGKQYRRAFWVDEKVETRAFGVKIRDGQDGIAEALKSIDTDAFANWFDFANEGKLPGDLYHHTGALKAGTRKFCKYDPNFVYQYAKIGFEEGEIPPDKLISAIDHDLQEAFIISRSFGKP